MAKVLLFTPPYHSGVVEAAIKCPPLGLVTIAGELRDRGHEVEIYDAMMKDHAHDHIRAHILAAGPDYVGTGTYTASLPDALTVLKAVKATQPHITTIIGGIHANFQYEEVLGDESVDFVVRGEGEITTAELIDALESGDDINQVRGIAYRDVDRVIATPERPFIEDLDSLKPAWDLLDWRDYTIYVIPGSTVGLVGSSRGCLFGCSFCSQQKFWKQTYRQRSAEAFVAEIETLAREHGVDVVLLSDELPTKDRERWEQILDLLIKKDLGVYVMMETRVTDVLRDVDIIDKYRRAGIVHVYVGVEATNQETLDRFKKDIKVEESKEALDLLNNAGIITECSFVVGLPQDTDALLDRTYELALHYNPDFAHFLLLAPWPYADMYGELKDYIVARSYKSYNFVRPVIKPEAMTTEHLLDRIIDFYKDYYRRKLIASKSEPDRFKREYMVRSIKVLLDRSFLKDRVADMGPFPKIVNEYLAEIINSPEGSLFEPSAERRGA